MTRGIAEITAGELKHKIQNWRYYEGKKRVIKGQTFNLCFIRISVWPYHPYSISTTAFFVLDKKHVRKGSKLKMLEEIETWSGWANYTPNKYIKAKLVHIEKKEKTLEAILKEPYECSRFDELEFS